MAKRKQPEQLQAEEVQKKADEKRTKRLEALQAVKELSDKDSKWTLTEEIFQEIQAGHIVSNPNQLPPVTQMRQELISEIKTRYKDEPDVMQVLVDSVPEARTIRKWIKRDGWEDDVWTRLRGDKLFSPANRAQVLEALRVRAINKSDQAAKIWLTISGDYSDKIDVTDKTVDTYRDINNILHGKKNEEG
jgi:hypothetical protein